MIRYKPEGIYDGMTQAEALRQLAKRYLRKPECVALCNGVAADMIADAKASGWRDIESDPPDETRDVVLCWEPAAFDGIEQLGPAHYYVSSGYDLNNQYACGTEDQNPTHWQPLHPPPGEEDGDDVDTIYQEAHRASVRSTIATSMKREEALRAENAHMIDALRIAGDLLLKHHQHHLDLGTVIFPATDDMPDPVEGECPACKGSGLRHRANTSEESDSD